MKALLALFLAAATLLADEPTPPTPEPDVSTVVEWSWTLETVASRTGYCPSDPREVTWTEDGYYTAPSQADIDSLLAFFKARREMIPWLPEVWDCDDKATEFKYLAALWSVREWHGRFPGVLVGKAYVSINGFYPLFGREEWVTGCHVLNFVVRADGQMFYVEPQTGIIMDVSSFVYEGSIEIIRLEY